MAESNGSLWDKQPGPDWFPEDYLREAGRQTHRDYLPSLSRSLSEDFRDYVVGTRDIREVKIGYQYRYQYLK